MLAAIAIAGCGLVPRSITGSGQIVEEQLPIEAFRSLEVGASFRVTVERGETHELQVRIDDNVREHLLVEERDGSLTINLADGIRVRSATLEVHLTVVSLDAVRARGSSSIELQDALTAASVDVAASGSSRVTGDLESARVTVTSSGSSELELGMAAGDLAVRTSGSSQVRVHGAAGALTINGSGSSQADLGELQSDGADVQLSGSSSATIGPSDQLAVQLSGSSSLRYGGDPRITSERRSGSASLDQTDGDS